MRVASPSVADILQAIAKTRSFGFSYGTSLMLELHELLLFWRFHVEMLWVWRALFMENANKLLAWAEIEGRTVKQLIEMKGSLLRLRLHRLSLRGLWVSDFAICRYPTECFESYPTGW
jgi:hypothetical protein